MHPTSRLVLLLAQAARRRDPFAVTQALRTLADHEDKKKSGGIAPELRRLIPQNGRQPQDAESLKHLNELTPTVQLDQLVLDDDVRETCADLILEQRKTELLANAGLTPRNRMLLIGPPGNGKTSLAEAIASSLKLPFYTVGYDTLTGSYLGQTAGRLRGVLDYAASHECVVLFDEFEAVGKEREDDQEVGEMKRTAAALLVRIERMPASTIVIAATNHPGMLDRATWRRFQITLQLETPEKAQLIDYLKSRCHESANLKVNPQSVADILEGASYAEAAKFCDDIERSRVLFPLRNADTLLQTRLRRWTDARHAATEAQGRTWHTPSRRGRKE